MENEGVAQAIAKAIVSVDPDLMYVALAGAKSDLMTRIGGEVGLFASSFIFSIVFPRSRGVSNQIEVTKQVLRGDFIFPIERPAQP